MITRIPQPQWVGPAPADVIASAGAQGAKMAEIFSQGISESERNYTEQQKVKVEEERNKVLQQNAGTEAKNAQTESDKLRYGLMAKNLSDDLQANGPMSYVNRKDEWLQLFTFEGGGDAEKGKALYEGGAKALNQITGLQALRGNLLAVSSQGGQAPATPATPAQPQAPAMPVGPAATSPLAPFAGQQAPSAAPAPMAQGASPQASPTAMPLVGNQAMSITQITKGLPNNAATQAATAGLQKMASTDPETSLTSKDIAAVNNVLKPHVEILKNQTVKDYYASGGSEEALAKARDQLNTALQDPTFAQWFSTESMFSPKEATEFAQSVTADVKRAAQEEAVRHNLESERSKLLALNLQANKAILQSQMTYERLQLMASMAKDVKTRASATAQLGSLKLADDMLKTFAQQGDQIRNSFPKGTDEAKIQQAMNEKFADPSSPLSQTLNAAAKLWSSAYGQDFNQTVLQFKGTYFAGLPLPFLQTKEGGEVSVPFVPPPTQRPPLRAGAAIVNPNAGNNSPPQTANAPLTDKQKSRVMQGQPPGPPD